MAYTIEKARAAARKRLRRETSKKPHLAEVHTIYPSNFRDCAATIKEVQQGIVEGRYGDVQEHALVLWSGDQGILVFSGGKHSDAASAHLLLTAGAQMLTGPLLRHKSPAPTPGGAA